MKKNLKPKALKLRERGYSIAEISRRIKISKSTAYVWVKEVKLSFSAKKRIQERSDNGRARGMKTNKRKRQQLIASTVARVKKDLARLRHTREIDKVLCSFLYWCEGNKDQAAVGFTNSDPLLMATFLKLFRSAYSLDESKFRICLHLHEYHKEKKQKKFWSKILDIPLEQFSRIYRKPHTGRNYRKGYPGCVSLRYYDYKVAMELCAVWKLFGQEYGRVV